MTGQHGHPPTVCLGSTFSLTWGDDLESPGVMGSSEGRRFCELALFVPLITQALAVQPSSEAL